MSESKLAHIQDLIYEIRNQKVIDINIRSEL